MFILYLDCIRDVQQSETKDGKHKIKPRQKYSDNIHTEQIVSVYVFCLKKYKDLLILYTLYKGLNKKIRRFSNLLANFGFVFVSLVLVVRSMTTFLPEIILAKYFMLGKHQSMLTNV